MSRASQPIEPPDVDGFRAHDAALEPFKVGDALPVCMSVRDMCRAFPANGKPRGRSSFHRLERAGKFRKFELTGIAGDKCWSGAKVQRFLNGEAIDTLRASHARRSQAGQR